MVGAGELGLVLLSLVSRIGHDQAITVRYNGSVLVCLHFLSQRSKDSNIPLIQVHHKILIIRLKIDCMIVATPVRKSISSVITSSHSTDVRFKSWFALVQC